MTTSTPQPLKLSGLDAVQKAALQKAFTYLMYEKPERIGMQYGHFKFIYNDIDGNLEHAGKVLGFPITRVARDKEFFDPKGPEGNFVQFTIDISNPEKLSGFVNGIIEQANRVRSKGIRVNTYELFQRSPDRAVAELKLAEDEVNDVLRALHNAFYSGNFKPIDCVEVGFEGIDKHDIYWNEGRAQGVLRTAEVYSALAKAIKEQLEPAVEVDDHKKTGAATEKAITG